MTNWSTCCFTQTSQFCLQRTVGVCQANKDNITFRVAHKTWNAIYRKSLFPKHGSAGCQGDRAERLEPTSVEPTMSTGRRLHTLTCQELDTEQGIEGKTQSSNMWYLLKCKNFPLPIRVTKIKRSNNKNELQLHIIDVAPFIPEGNIWGSVKPYSHRGGGCLGELNTNERV